MNKIKLFKFLPVFLLAAGITSAQLVTFDTLSGGGVPVPNGYNGFDWSNFNSFDPDTASTYLTSGYHYGRESLNNVAYGTNGLVASISDASGFDLSSGYFTAAWADGLSLQVIGYNGITQSYTNTYTLSNIDPLSINFGYHNVTSVTFQTSGGPTDSSQFVADNLTLNHVPEAGSTLVMLGAALAGLALLPRRFMK